MRLTAFSKFLIVLAVVAVAFFGFRYFMSNSSVSKNQDTTTEQKESKSDDNTQAPNPSSDIESSFNFTPPAPVNGKLKGVVELGASGFNSFIVKIDDQKRWSLSKAEFGSSLVHENMATSTDIREGLKNYIAGMLNYGVNGKDIHFVVSSGASKSEQVAKISAELKKLGYVVNPVTPEKEGQLALKCVLPDAYINDAFVVDIGSSNTKISWMQGDRIKSIETYGSKYFQNGVTDGKVYDEVEKLASQIPSDRRLVCFMIGGAPFDLAKTHRNGKERYTVLKAPDDYQTQEAKTKAGINIYRALRNATGCDTFVFDWDSNFTIGFLLTI
ncbi:MAG: hypothetical protein SFU99_09760 [Saprospiraceae bacterium]|nr:hypothetical protein [Saprospiraceae bacterium]